MLQTSERAFSVGDRVTKTSGDYRFEGVIVAAFVKLDGRSWRYVVENSDGVLHIFSAKQLAPITHPKEAPYAADPGSDERPTVTERADRQEPTA
jgi:hypothetical protein